MMTKQLTLTTLALLAAALLVQPAYAADTAEAFTDAAGVSIQPLVAHDGMTVRVSGPEGIVSEWYFAAGESATIFSAELSDGAYTWEASLFPRIDAATRQQLKAARQRGEDISNDLRAQGKLPSEPLGISGHFVIKGGAMVVDTEEQVGSRGPAGPASSPVSFDSNAGQALGGLDNQSAADQQFLDDVIIVGSACVGLDCNNGENFGFDTIRLKENNLRIRAFDTSASASFPTNDWQITFNDTTNGGKNKFAIDDIDGGRTPFTIEASAPTDSLYVEDGGRIGFGTATPVVTLHVVDGNTPTLRLEQDGSSGFTPQTWDMAGNEANFFIRDATNGSKLPIQIKPSAPTASIFIAEDGDVGLGTAAPTAGANLDVVGDTGLAAMAVRTSDNGTVFSIAATANSVFIGPQTPDALVFNIDANSEAMRITENGQVAIGCNTGLGVNDFLVSGTGDAELNCSVAPASTLVAGATAFVASSSRTYKENLQPIPAEGILEKLSAIDVYNYDFIDGKKDVIGLVAEDFHQVFQKGSDKLLNGQEVQMALFLAVKELAASNAELKAELEQLKAAAQQ